ncbi:MAG: thiamine-phosphate kinase [Desulfovibrionaceae bacterium]|nr:thiamine-phosphate kinase [Desulfovibrionaceae bacterium]MBF0513492.1 thiamine-phosphate kinase [Desulfovibrionaceae bacterium]
MPFAGEDDFLRLIDAHFPNAAPGLILGRGDDAAVIQHPGPIAVSSDLFLEDVHFRRSYFTAAAIGRKALAVNLSDLAAMGAQPLGFTLNIGAPPDLASDFWPEFFAAMAQTAARHKAVLAGGDLSRCERLAVSVTVWGGLGPAGRFLRRGQGRPGDFLFVVGELGLARAGLLGLEATGRAALTQFPAACRAHLDPTALIKAGLLLAGIAAVRGLMDVSDGLLMDLPRFLGPGLGASLDLHGFPLHAETVRYAASAGVDPIRFALEGGEDYALLGCVAPEGTGELKKRLPGARLIGVIGAAPGVWLGQSPVATGGFDHFRPAGSPKGAK